MQTINEILSSRSDESILSMQENKAKEVVAKMKIYGMCHLICKQFYNVSFNVIAHSSLLLSVDEFFITHILTPFEIANLGHVLHFLKPSLSGDLSIRMTQLTLTSGLVPTSPYAFAYYGAVLVVVGRVKEGCRLGTYHIIMCEQMIYFHFCINSMLNKYLYIISLFAGRLALKLVENKLALVNRSAIILAVYFGILWTCEP